MQNNQDFSLFREFARKGFHLILLILPIGYYFLGKWQMLQILTPITAIVVLVDYFRSKNDILAAIFNKVFGLILRQKELEKGKFCGATFALIAALLIFLIAKKEIAITSFLILAVCDLMASLVGKSIKSANFYEKSVAGSAAFFLSGIVVLIISGQILSFGIWFYFFAIFALFVAMILEARPSYLGIDDNFVVPISYSIVMMIFDLMWHIV
jgi:dolichol kinase